MNQASEGKPVTHPTTNRTGQQTRLRYRLYFWLMDFSLFFATLAIASMPLEYFAGIDIMPRESWWGALVGVPTVISVTLLPFLLIWARFMRDEYAELLWNRTMVIVGYAAASLPLLMMLAAWLTWWLIDREEAGVFEPLLREKSVYEFLSVSWVVFLLVFVCTFQFLRWKDSR